MEIHRKEFFSQTIYSEVLDRFLLNIHNIDQLETREEIRRNLGERISLLTMEIHPKKDSRTTVDTLSNFPTISSGNNAQMHRREKLAEDILIVFFSLSLADRTSGEQYISAA